MFKQENIYKKKHITYYIPVYITINTNFWVYIEQSNIIKM